MIWSFLLQKSIFIKKLEFKEDQEYFRFNLYSDDVIGLENYCEDKPLVIYFKIGI